MSMEKDKAGDARLRVRQRPPTPPLPRFAGPRPVMTSLAQLYALLRPCPSTDAPDIRALPLHDGPVPHLDTMGGDTVLHCDLREDNLFIATAPRPSTGPGDAVFLVSQPILAGHTAKDAEKHVLPPTGGPRRSGHILRRRAHRLLDPPSPTGQRRTTRLPRPRYPDRHRMDTTRSS